MVETKGTGEKGKGEGKGKGTLGGESVGAVWIASFLKPGDGFFIYFSTSKLLAVYLFSIFTVGCELLVLHSHSY